MYHSISENSSNRMHPYYTTNTSPGVFSEHMRCLNDNNYSVIDLRNVQEHLRDEGTNGTRSVVLTFDDGYSDFFTHAYEIIKEYNFPSTVFLPTGLIKEKARRNTITEYLSWSEVRELHRDGVYFGAHSVTHPQLRLLNRKQIEYEIKKSKLTIEDELGTIVNSFSYPYKFPEADKEFVNYLQNTLLQLGYTHGVSTRIGTTNSSDNIYFMKRIPINTYDDISLFKAKLEGGYNWLYLPQYASKVVKKIFNFDRKR